ncbi:MAG: hypothetical protein IPL92_12210 [Saprospiraceae bacterium]|nr:hypothetical protein [Candidatus Opimibacter iunctus]
MIFLTFGGETGRRESWITSGSAWRHFLFYSFTETIDPSTFGTHILTTWIDFPSDVNPSNDSTSYTFTNYPPLNTPPGNLIPASGTTGLENQVSLSWSPVTNAASYKLFIGQYGKRNPCHT